jgi:hypothetical protein
MNNFLMVYIILSLFVGIFTSFMQLSPNFGIFKPIVRPLFNNENFNVLPRIILSILLEVILIGSELVRFTVTLLLFFVYFAFCLIMLILEKDKSHAKDRLRNIFDYNNWNWEMD